MKRCDELQERLTCYVLGDLDEVASNEIREHLAQCEQCQKEVRDIEKTIGFVQNALGATAPKSKELDSDKQNAIYRMKEKKQRSNLIYWFFGSHPALKVAASLAVILGLVALYLMPRQMAQHRAVEVTIMSPMQAGPDGEVSDKGFAYDLSMPDVTYEAVGNVSGERNGAMVDDFEAPELDISAGDTFAQVDSDLGIVEEERTKRKPALRNIDAALSESPVANAWAAPPKSLVTPDERPLPEPAPVVVDGLLGSSVAGTRSVTRDHHYGVEGGAAGGMHADANFGDVADAPDTTILFYDQIGNAPTPGAVKSDEIEDIAGESYRQVKTEAESATRTVATAPVSSSEPSEPKPQNSIPLLGRLFRSRGEGERSSETVDYKSGRGGGGGGDEAKDGNELVAESISEESTKLTYSVSGSGKTVTSRDTLNAANVREDSVYSRVSGEDYAKHRDEPPARRELAAKEKALDRSSLVDQRAQTPGDSDFLFAGGSDDQLAANGAVVGGVVSGPDPTVDVSGMSRLAKGWADNDAEVGQDVGGNESDMDELVQERWMGLAYVKPTNEPVPDPAGQVKSPDDILEDEVTYKVDGTALLRLEAQAERESKALKENEEVLRRIEEDRRKKEAAGEKDEILRFKAAGVNPYVQTRNNAFSTFAIDVDTASYHLARRYMQAGLLPPAESVRTEEFVNAFDYHYQAPIARAFRVYADAAPSPFGHGQQMFRIGVKGKRLGREEQRPAMLTFVVDASGSMDRPDRMGLVQHSLKLLVGQLAAQDQVAIVQYGTDARLVLAHTPVTRKEEILASVSSLQCGGATDLEQGLRLAYRVAAENYVSGAENRVVLLSDGVANMGEGSADTILNKIAAYREQGVSCSVYGFGVGNYDDVMLETLANKGDGVYTFIGGEDDARRAFVDELSASLNTIAKDVKIQVEFNPNQVARYRQVGYENRQLTKQDFRNDSVDAGEVGSGQSVTALYETDLVSRRSNARWQSDSGWFDGDVVAVVRVRYQDVASGRIEEIEHPIRLSDVAASFEDADVRFKLAVGVAEFSEILRGSPHAAGASFDAVASILRPVASELHLDQRVQEFARFAALASGFSRGEFQQ